MGFRDVAQILKTENVEVSRIEKIKGKKLENRILNAYNTINIQRRMLRRKAGRVRWQQLNQVTEVIARTGACKKILQLNIPC